MKYLKPYLENIEQEETQAPIENTINIEEISKKIVSALNAEYTLDNMSTKDYIDKIEFVLNTSFSIFVYKKTDKVTLKWRDRDGSHQEDFTSIGDCIKKLASKI